MKPTSAELVRRVLDRLADAPPGGRVMIGIAGSPGAGKTTLAENLVLHLGAELSPERVAHVPMDGFHLADVALDRLGLRTRKGAPETFDTAGYLALLLRLRANTDQVVYAASFDRDLEQPIAGSIGVDRSVQVIVTEGNYLLLDGPWAQARDLLDEIWFCLPTETVRLERLLARHVQFGKSPEFARSWVARNDQPNADLVASTCEHANLVITID